MTPERVRELNAQIVDTMRQLVRVVATYQHQLICDSGLFAEQPAPTLDQFVRELKFDEQANAFVRSLAHQAYYRYLAGDLVKR